MKARAIAWWNARNKRERWLAAVAGFALLAGIVELTALAPQRAERDRLQKEILASRAQLDRLRATAAELGARHASTLTPEALAERRRAAQSRIDRAQAELLSPQDMGRHLKTILLRHPQLRVVGIQTLPPKAVDAAGSGAGAALYEHGLRVDVEGRYLDLLAYLESLEGAPHRIFWRSLEMKAEADVPVTRVELFTLSKEQTWLRL